MARTKHSHKKIHKNRHTSETIRMPVKFDTWRWVDLGLLIASIGFLAAGRFLYIPVLFILLTALELIFESAIRRSNRDWQDTAEGKDWVRRMISAGRLFFIPTKILIFLVALYLLSV